MKYVRLYAKDSPALRDFKRKYAFANGLRVCWNNIEEKNVFEVHLLCPDCKSMDLSTFRDVFGVVWQWCINCKRVIGIIGREEVSIGNKGL